jgi:hypothetical protein
LEHVEAAYRIELGETVVAGATTEIPNPNIQAPNKVQYQNPNRRVAVPSGDARNLDWDLEVEISLGFGAWDLPNDLGF